MPQVIGRDGRAQEFTPTLEMYRAAGEQGLSLAQHINNTVDTDAETYGTPFEQVLASAGMFLQHDRTLGIRPPTISHVLSGGVDINMGVVTRPDGTNALTPSGRVLFPAVIMEMVESQLREDQSGYTAIYNQMIALTQSINSPRWDHPIINLTGPRGSRVQPIAQLAEPPTMVSITLSEKSYRIPTFSIGLEISDEAAKASTLDLVGIAVREQTEAERVARIDDDLKRMVDGDTDLGMTALTSQTAQSYDAAITAAGTMTQKAWLKWLRKDYKKLSIDWVMCDIDTYLAIEGRTGRPTQQNNRGGDERLNTVPTAANPGLPDTTNFFLVEPTVFGANTLVGIDSKKAIRKVVYVGATYQAIEEFVMRRSTAMRFDFAEATYRLIDGAWKKLTLTV